MQAAHFGILHWGVFSWYNKFIHWLKMSRPFFLPPQKILKTFKSKISFFTIFKGIVPQLIFYHSNCIFWILDFWDYPLKNWTTKCCLFQVSFQLLQIIVLLSSTQSCWCWCWVCSHWNNQDKGHNIFFLIVGNINKKKTIFHPCMSSLIFQTNQFVQL